jgi:enoyl-CoA hydratase
MLVLSERVGNVQVVTLNRPEAANSLNLALLEELDAALVDVLADPDARVMVLTGAGPKVFCAGMDLAALAEMQHLDGPPGGPTASALLQGSFAKPLVAAVNGAAVGGGFELVLACDLVVAADHARFGLPEVKRGLFAAGGGTLLSTRVPLAVALELGLTGRLVDAAWAREAGLVNQVVAADGLLDAALALAGEVAANGPLGVQLTKQLMRDAVTVGPQSGRATPEQNSSIFSSQDAVEGATAFMEKRPPRFTGQ